MKKHKNIAVVFCFVFVFVLLFFLFAVYFLSTPRNDRDWGNDTDRLPIVQFTNKVITVSNIRNFQYQGKKLAVKEYVKRTFLLSDLVRVWFVVEPFELKPYSYVFPSAHTYFVFDFKNQDPIVVSVESRREKNEDFNIIAGLFNQYELIYVWGTEKDITGRRVEYEDNTVYMFPLLIDSFHAKKLFVTLAQKTHALETHPRFYNTLTSSCTTELAKVANEVKPGSVAVSIAWLLPGLSIQQLYKEGFIPHGVSLEETKKRYAISDVVKKYYNQKDFSEKLRDYLLR